MRYRGVFADGTYDVAQEVIVWIFKANDPPSADAGPDQVVFEGSTVTLSAAGSMDPEGNPLTYTWELIDATGPDVSLSSPSDVSPTFFAPDDGTYTFSVAVSDNQGGTDADDVMVTVQNQQPAVGDIIAPTEPIMVNTAVNVVASFSDQGQLDTHSAIWEWGDDSTSQGAVDESNGSGLVTGSHTYVAPGVYTIHLRVIDKDGGTSDADFRYVVVYDPEGGFVTGGGWFDSPAGSYAGDPSLTGKANFGFNAKYKKDESTPSGQVQFGLQTGDLDFHSINYEWLVITGGRAQLKGIGTINREGEYEFMITMVDGDIPGGDGIDRFRIKMWDLGTGEVPYDNQIGDPDEADLVTILGGGSIVIHE